MFSREMLQNCEANLFRVLKDKNLFFEFAVTVLKLKSWRQIHLSSRFRIPSVYWGIIKCAGQRLDILCQNIVKIHTILYQTTKETTMSSVYSPACPIFNFNKINIKFRISFWMKLAKNCLFWMHYTVFRALFWLLRLSSLFQISRRNYNGN